MKQKQEMNNNDQSVFTTIRISREVYNDLPKRGWYKATHITTNVSCIQQNKDPSRPKQATKELISWYDRLNQKKTSIVKDQTLMTAGSRLKSSTGFFGYLCNKEIAVKTAISKH